MGKAVVPKGAREQRCVILRSPEDLRSLGSCFNAGAYDMEVVEMHHSQRQQVVEYFLDIATYHRVSNKMNYELLILCPSGDQ